MKTLRDYTAIALRLMDLRQIKVYVDLLSKELSLAKVQLATLMANEQALVPHRDRYQLNCLTSCPSISCRSTVLCALILCPVCY